MKGCQILNQYLYLVVWSVIMGTKYWHHLDGVVFVWVPFADENHYKYLMQLFAEFFIACFLVDAEGKCHMSAVFSPTF